MIYFPYHYAVLRQFLNINDFKYVPSMVSILRRQTAVSGRQMCGGAELVPSDTTTADRPDKTLGQMNSVTYASYISFVEHFEI